MLYDWTFLIRMCNGPRFSHSVEAMPRWSHTRMAASRSGDSGLGRSVLVAAVGPCFETLQEMVLSIRPHQGSS